MPYQLKFAPLAPKTWEKLDQIERTGWVMRSVKHPETVQEHTLALIRLAETLPGISTELVNGLCEILEVHDWPEAIVGDEVILVHDDEVLKQQLKAAKHEREEAAMQEICVELGDVGQIILVLWERYEAGSDAAAKLAKEIDKLQAIEQALEYEVAQGIPGLFKEFRDYLLPVFSHPATLAHLQAIEIRAQKHNIIF